METADRHINTSLIAGLSAYLIINNIFIIKYVSRLDNINEYLVAALFTATIVLLLVFFYHTSIRNSFYKYLFISLLATFFIFTVYLNITVDGTLLNVDRWSAMQEGIRAMLSGEYPYAATDHLGGRTSNLPTLLLAGIPFYLMGNIGLLQSFSFLVFGFIIYRSFGNYKARTLALLLLVMAPSYLWEIYVKSDLMTNFIFILLFFIILQSGKSSWKLPGVKAEAEAPAVAATGSAMAPTAAPGGSTTASIAAVAAALILTRLTAFIPLALLLSARFFRSTLREKSIFMAVALGTAIILLFLGFHRAGSVENFSLYNPFSLQNRQLPLAVSVLVLIIPVVLSFYAGSFRRLVGLSAALLLLPVTIAFGMAINQYGISRSIFESSFDISYFNMAMPFIITGIGLTAANTGTSELPGQIIHFATPEKTALSKTHFPPSEPQKHKP